VEAEQEANLATLSSGADDAAEMEPYCCEGRAGAFFCFTSNVDAHSFDVFEACEIRECHGNVELWQCRDWNCGGSQRIWRAPIDHRFFVNTDTMRAPEDAGPDFSVSPKDVETSENKTFGERTSARVGHTFGSDRLEPLKFMIGSHRDSAWYCGEHSKNYPKCTNCGSNARPAILMFGDFDWKDNEPQLMRWIAWKTSLFRLCCEMSSSETTAPLRVCILEIGCGLNVSTCRSQSEDIVKEVRKAGGEAKLVRINADFPLPDDDSISDDVISVMARGLKALKEIEKHYRSRK